MDITIQDKLLEHFREVSVHLLASATLTRTMLDDQKQPIVPILALYSQKHLQISMMVHEIVQLLEAYQDVISSDPYLIQNYDKMTKEEVSDYCGKKFILGRKDRPN